MSAYPNNIDTFRQKENLPGHPFDSANKKAFFVEDIQALESDVVAIESELGLNPSGIFDNVASRLDSFDLDIEQANYLKIIKALGSSIRLVSVGSGYQFSSFSSSSGSLRMSAIFVPRAMSFTGIAFSLLTPGVFSEDAFNGVGLYKIVGSNLVLVAVSANNANIFKGPSQSVVFVPFTSQFNAEPGVYFCAVLVHYISQTTVPVLGVQATNFSVVGLRLDFPSGVPLNIFLSGQTALSSSIPISSIGATGFNVWFGLY